ncbi:MAG: FHA domain-containing protein [Bacteroidales bacterium]|nr:FHA domain-containing protein [Bacteroidales bacterium]
MEEIIIGREGNQAFKIPNTCNEVSRKHAKITIDDNGKWYLEDLKDNGTTFYMDENGSYRQTSGKFITPNTTIRLGINPNVSFVFRAGQIKGEKIQWGKLWHQLNKTNDDYNMQIEQMKNKIKLHNKIKIIAPIIWAVLLSPFFKKFGMITGVFMLPGFIANLIFFGDNDKLTALIKEKSQKMRCPNPQCGKQLSEDEVKNMRCNYCKCHYTY